MTNPRNPSVFEWLFSVGLLLVGISTLGISLFGLIYGTTAEEELTMAEGAPSEANLSYVSGRYEAKTYIVKFTVAGYHTEYSSADPKYEQVLSAIKSGERLRIWVSTKQETIFPRQGWVPLYKLSIGDRPILAYADVVTDEAGRSWSVLIVDGFLISVGVWGTWLCVRNRRRYVSSVSTGPEGRLPVERVDEAENLEKKV